MARKATIPELEDLRHKDPLERVTQIEIENKLRVLGWFVQRMHGSMYQSGVPDIWCSHAKYGPRWIEVKRKSGHRFTAAQQEKFPQMAAAGATIHVAFSVDEIPTLLFKAPNWYMYLYGVMKL